MAEDFGATLSFDLSRPGRIGALVPLVVFCALALVLAAGCGNGTKKGQGPTGPDMTVEQARGFNEFTLYWLGDTYKGLPLTKIERALGGVEFIYGTCTTEDPSGECNLPIVLQERPFCLLLPTRIATAAKQSSVFKIRGADAQVISGGTVLWAGDVSITIFNDTLDASIERLAALSLAPINRSGGEPGTPLPATSHGTCSGYFSTPSP